MCVCVSLFIPLILWVVDMTLVLGMISFLHHPSSSLRLPSPFVPAWWMKARESRPREMCSYFMIGCRVNGFRVPIWRNRRRKTRWPSPLLLLKCDVCSRFPGRALSRVRRRGINDSGGQWWDSHPRSFLPSLPPPSVSFGMACFSRAGAANGFDLA